MLSLEILYWHNRTAHYCPSTDASTSAYATTECTAMHGLVQKLWNKMSFCIVVLALVNNVM